MRMQACDYTLVYADAIRFRVTALEVAVLNLLVVIV